MPQGSVLGPTPPNVYKINCICDAASDLMLPLKCLQMMQKYSVYSTWVWWMTHGLHVIVLYTGRELVNVYIATNNCFALRTTNNTEHETTSADRYMLGGENLNWCTEAHYMGVLVDNQSQFNHIQQTLFTKFTFVHA